LLLLPDFSSFHKQNQEMNIPLDKDITLRLYTKHFSSSCSFKNFHSDEYTNTGFFMNAVNQIREMTLAMYSALYHHSQFSLPELHMELEKFIIRMIFSECQVNVEFK
jgi:hypothetical protein